MQTQGIRRKLLICNKLVGPEGHRFLREINTLADGSPTHFPSYSIVWHGEPKDQEED